MVFLSAHACVYALQTFFFSLSFLQEGFSSMRGQQQQQQEQEEEEEEEEEEEDLLSTHTHRKKFSQSCCFCSCV